MSDGPNRALRIVVPLILAGIGIIVVAPMFRGAPQSQPQQTGQSQTKQEQPEGASKSTDGSQATTPANSGDAKGSSAAADAEPASEELDAATDAGNAEGGERPPQGSPTEEASKAAPETDAARATGRQPPPQTLGTLRPRIFDPDAALPVLGSEDPAGPYLVQVEFSANGAGVKRLSFRDHWQSVAQNEHAVVQEVQVDPVTSARLIPLAALHVRVGDQKVLLVEPGAWRVKPGATPTRSLVVFEALLENEQGEPVVRLERAYSLDEDTYSVVLRQRVFNQASAPLEVELTHFGPVDLPKSGLGYGGDLRRVRFGYLADPQSDPSRQTVLGEKFKTQGRLSGAVLGKKENGKYAAVHELWPTDQTSKNGLELVWLGMTNRYFGVALHPLVDPNAQSPRKVFDNVASVDRILTSTNPEDKSTTSVGLRMHSGARTVAPGGSTSVDMGLYAGPLSRSVIKDEARARAAGLDSMVVYAYGSCSFCTFSWLTGLLLELLHLLALRVFSDWSLAIISLVLIVRTALHPITRWSQVRMLRFGKQMQALGPKMKKIQEKYKDDRRKLQEETARLYREEGINPAGMLGCLPMFLQTPVWIALYAVLMFDFDLRHEAAFFGVFQSLLPLQWHLGGWFLSDMAEPDRFYYFGYTLFTIPLMGAIQSINLLPLLMGVVFFLQQKYLTPPTTGSMSPEQEQQQKIMKIMMVVMMPVIMYNAPSGLALYFIANSTLGIFESRHIRKNAEAKGLLEPKKRPPGKPGGFMARLMEMAEQQRRQQARAGKSGPNVGKRKR